ncbi:hypothetical protein CAEBREN_15914 [Caenorhabditis brenneri]|uniref:Uncharacterized protein n=1 Tax=Caenorhabditis brenneri TaxID=135651 RepID=G0N028_CAEBE|nr:hypothetical protein CAEBREN_15914 [Caenorhabditis brenneri]
MFWRSTATSLTDIETLPKIKGHCQKLVFRSQA